MRACPPTRAGSSSTARNGIRSSAIRAVHPTLASDRKDAPRQARLCLLRVHVLRSRTFRTLTNGEGHALPFTQIIKAGSDAAGLMKKIFGPVSCSDESEAFVGLTLDRASRQRHKSHLLPSVGIRAVHPVSITRSDAEIPPHQRGNQAGGVGSWPSPNESLPVHVRNGAELLDETFSQRFGDGFGLGMDLQLFVDALHMKRTVFTLTFSSSAAVV